MPVELLPTLWVWSSHLLYGVLLWLAIRQVDWLRLRERRTVQHLCGGGVLLLSMLWQLRSGLLPGLEIGLLGLTALTLVMGWSFAVVVSSVALLIGFLVKGGSWESFSLAALTGCVVPVSVSYLACLIEQLLKFRPFFAYIFISAFFGGAAVAVVVAFCKTLIFWLGGVYSLQDIFQQYLPYALLIAFPEGFINGMVITGIMVFAPQYLRTLDQARYETSR